MRNEIKIFDNFLPSNIADKLENILVGHEFDWYFLNLGTCCQEDIDANPNYASNDTPQFVHIFFHNTLFKISPYFNDISVLIDRIEEKEKKGFRDRAYRIKSNILMSDNSSDPDKHHMPHKDLEEPVESLIYYVNDADGDTFIFNEDNFDNGLTIKKRITPKKNRAVLFNSNLLHASSSPKNSKFRIVINSVFYKK